jgi:hypothetical protein
MEIQTQDSERRWLRAVLILGTFVLGLVLLGQVATILASSRHIITILLLAWLFASCSRRGHADPARRAAPARVVVVGGIYVLLALAVVWLTLTVPAAWPTVTSHSYCDRDPQRWGPLRQIQAPIRAAQLLF